MFFLAQGNQGPEGIHQDREKRTEELAQRLKDNYQEEQEERHHQVQTENIQIPLHTQG